MKKEDVLLNLREMKIETLTMIDQLKDFGTRVDHIVEEIEKD